MKNFILLLLTTLSFFSSSQVIVDGIDFQSLPEAKPAIKDGSVIYLKAGIYTTGAYLSANNIEIIGEEGVIFDNAAVNGKAALVLTGHDIIVENIECRNIYVKDLNGACIRFEGENLTVRNLYAHDSQSGIMTNYNDGKLTIEHSKFERLGGKATGRGYAHAIYANVGVFEFKNSILVSMGKQGSGLKSRSRKTIVTKSVLATLDGKDSRLIDAADYGELIVTNSILQQGNNSSNSQLIAYGLEKRPVKFKRNLIRLQNNLFLFDRQKANVILKQKQATTVEVKDNIFVGDFLYSDKYINDNAWYRSRENARMKPYPYVPTIDDLSYLKQAIIALGEAE